MGNSYFRESEMSCRHCGWYVEHEDFLERLTQARVLADIPFRINSWCRCPYHDKQVKGESNHTTGRAVDIAYNTPQERATIVFALIRSGFERVGIDYKRNFIHADMVEDRPSPAIWSYS
jgi:hypothetical protein